MRPCWFGAWRRAPKIESFFQLRWVPKTLGICLSPFGTDTRQKRRSDSNYPCDLLDPGVVTTAQAIDCSALKCLLPFNLRLACVIGRIGAVDRVCTNLWWATDGDSGPWEQRFLDKLQSQIGPEHVLYGSNPGADHVQGELALQFGLTTSTPLLKLYRVEQAWPAPKVAGTSQQSRHLGA